MKKQEEEEEMGEGRKEGASAHRVGSDSSTVYEVMVSASDVQTGQ